MYKVKYYQGGNTLMARYFKTFSEAIHFSVYKVRGGDVYEIIKVD